LAFSNRAAGFYVNHHPVADRFYNNTSCYNHPDFNLLGVAADGTSNANIALLRNNVAFGGTLLSNNTGPQIDDANNSWSANLGVTVTAADFLDLTVTGLDGARAADGRQPRLPNFHLAIGSDLIDKGANIGLPYAGAAPDLGAFEYGDLGDAGGAPPDGAAGAAGAAGAGTGGMDAGRDGAGGAGGTGAGGVDAGRAGSSGLGGAAGIAGSSGKGGTAGTNGSDAGSTTTGVGGAGASAGAGGAGITGGSAGTSNGGTASGGVAGMSVATGGAGNNPGAETGGCSCHVAAHRKNAASSLLLVLFASFFARRRRQRRERQAP
jgi:hypothetical protein